ncbi:MAG: 23S rRNA (uracil(1939)-C(5))-methyltransferase RlmD [Bacteroidales bacterium]|nr:23S rRNA (uracil(1939)-C(5))-methyltransferase RlmD [Bacteroidales bacterium]
MSRKKTDILLENVEIESVAAEGKAIARVDGIVVFVEFAVPGDIVDIRVFKKKKNYMEGRIERIVRPSKDRLEPFCPHFGVCGGCRWQPLPYEMQLKAKWQQVYDQLVRIGHLEVPEIQPTLPSQETEFYRNKLEFSASERRWILSGEEPEGLGAEELAGLGFHVGKFFDKVLDIRDCHLQKEPSNAIRLFVKKFCLTNGIPFYNIRENRGFFRNMFIRNNRSGDIMLTMCFAAKRMELITPLLDALKAGFPQIKSLYYIINTKLNDSITDLTPILYYGDEAIYETMEGLRFKIGPKSFYQTNSMQAERLYNVARKEAALSGNEIVYDLYTGTGTIAQFIASKAKKVIGIEYVPEAIEDAVENARNNSVTNCEFYAGDMKDVLDAKFIDAHGKPDVIILDPPRAGIHPDVAKVILEASPKRIVYVSCNPATQARDLSVLCGKYCITAVRPVDMFPHTMHVENVVTLQLK